MTYKRKNSMNQLPRLQVPIEHEALRDETPPDLKGAQYPHLPPVGQINGTTPEGDEVLTLLPAIGEPHPCPYFISATVNLRTHVLDSIQVIGADADNAICVLDDGNDENNKTTPLEPIKEEKPSEDLAVEKLHQQFLISRALNSLDSSIDNTTEPKPDDENTRGILDGPIDAKDLEWLWPELDVHVHNVVWTIIEERVRLLPTVKHDEANKKTSQLDEQQQTALFARSFKKNHLQLDTSINSVPLQSLINELHLLSVQEKLMRNHVLEQVQDDVISQQIADVILDAALKEVDLQVNKLDEEERKSMPERM